MTMYDSHMHTPLCHHAVGDISDYAAQAQRCGLSGIIITCHNPLPSQIAANVRMAPDEFDHYLSLVARAKEAHAGVVDVRLGLECDYIPGLGLESWLERQSRAADYDYLLVAVHPHLPAYREQFWKNDPLAFQRQYFEHLADAAELRLHDAVAHPDLVKNVTPDAWQPERVLDPIRHCLDRIADSGMAMELNTSGWNKSVPEQNPGRLILREMAARQIPLVLGSDAHEPGRVGDRFIEALRLTEEAGYTSIAYYIGREQRTLTIQDAIRTLAPFTACSAMSRRGDV